MTQKQQNLIQRKSL